MKMKTVICFIALFCGLFIFLHAQSSYIRTIPITMPYPEFYEYIYTPKQIFPCPDGGVIILGDIQVHLYSGELEPYVNFDGGAIKLNAEGNCEWQWWSGDILSWPTPETGIIGIDQEADGRVNFIINNYFYNHHIYNKIGWIDPQGNSHLENITLPYCQLNAARRLPNGDIFAVGQGDAGALFLHLTAQGDTLSCHSIPPDSMSTWIIPVYGWGATAYDLEIDTDGFPVSTSKLTNRGASIIKTDWDGNVIWRRDTNNYSRVLPVPITKLTITNDLVFGYSSGNDDMGNKFSLYKITDTGIDSLFTIQLIDTECFGRYGSIIGHNQDIYLSGFYGDATPGNTDDQVHISNYNLSGQCLWNWTWQQDFIVTLIQPTDCIAVLPDSTIMHVLGSEWWGDYGLTIIRMLPNGTSVNDNTLPKPSLELHAYPNPMQTYIRVDIKSALPIKSQETMVSIFNLKGQLVSKLPMDKSLSAIWNGKDSNGFACSSGIYIIKINLNNSFITKKISLIK